MARRKVRPAADDSRRLKTIEIHTLGQFGLHVGGVPVEFQRRTQRRPLELLKALIALGRPAVAASRLMDALWRETEGDHAYRCLATTLYRLRELLRIKEAILHLGGQLSLNPRYCRVDAWEFERQLGALEAASRTQSSDPALLSRRHHEIARLYRGDFLDADRNCSWAEALRERLRARYLLTLRSWGQQLQKLGRHEEAIAAYHKGIEVNPLAEDCYRQLMCSLAALGRRTEAVLLYRRCCAVLESELDLQPAPETRSLYLGLCKKEGQPAEPFKTPARHQFDAASFKNYRPPRLSRRPNR